MASKPRVFFYAKDRVAQSWWQRIRACALPVLLLGSVSTAWACMCVNEEIGLSATTRASMPNERLTQRLQKASLLVEVEVLDLVQGKPQTQGEVIVLPSPAHAVARVVRVFKGKAPEQLMLKLPSETCPSTLAAESMKKGQRYVLPLGDAVSTRQNVPVYHLPVCQEAALEVMRRRLYVIQMDGQRRKYASRAQLAHRVSVPG